MEFPAISAVPSSTESDEECKDSEGSPEHRFRRESNYVAEGDYLPRKLLLNYEVQMHSSFFDRNKWRQLCKLENQPRKLESVAKRLLAGLAAVNLKGCDVTLFPCAWKHLVTGIGMSHTIGLITFSNCSLQKSHFIDLSLAVKSNETILELTLNGNEAGDDGASSLASAIENHPSLGLVELSNNKIGSGGFIAICQSLHNNSHLVYLYLHDNAPDKLGIEAVAQMLQINNTLETIGLSYNQVAVADACLLLNAIAINTDTRLSTLLLDDLGIQPGYEATKFSQQISRCLTRNTCLSSLSVRLNHLTIEDIRSVLTVLRDKAAKYEPGLEGNTACCCFSPYSSCPNILLQSPVRRFNLFVDTPDFMTNRAIFAVACKEAEFPANASHEITYFKFFLLFCLYPLYLILLALGFVWSAIITNKSLSGFKHKFFDNIEAVWFRDRVISTSVSSPMTETSTHYVQPSRISNASSSYTFGFKHFLLFLVISCLLYCYPFIMVNFGLTSNSSKLAVFSGICFIILLVVLFTLYTIFLAWKDHDLSLLDYPSKFGITMLSRPNILIFASLILDVFQLCGFSFHPDLYPDESILPTVFHASLFSFDLGTSANFGRWLSVIILSMIWVFLSGFLHLSLMLNKPWLLRNIPRIGLFVQLLTNTLYLTILSNLTVWLDCTYYETSEVWLLDLDSSVVCWDDSDGHKTLAMITLIVLLLYVLSVNLIGVFFIVEMNVSCQVHFVASYIMTDRAVKLFLTFIATFFSNYLAFRAGSSFMLCIIMVIFSMIWYHYGSLSAPCDNAAAFEGKIAIYSAACLSSLMSFCATFYEDPKSSWIFFYLVQLGWFCIAILYIFRRISSCLFEEEVLDSDKEYDIELHKVSRMLSTKRFNTSDE